MTETLAAILLARLTTAMPFLDRAVGLVRPYEFTVPNGDEVKRVKLPLPVSFTAADCDRDPRYLVPDAGTNSILFFEDNGTTSQGAGRAPAERTMESTVRLLIWLNPAGTGNPTTELALVGELYNALLIGHRRTAGPLHNLLLSWTIQPAGAGLFGAYSFAGETPLLYPPYRLFGAEIKAVYHFNPACYPPAAVVAPAATIPPVAPAPVPAAPTIANAVFTGDAAPVITNPTFTPA